MVILVDKAVFNVKELYEYLEQRISQNKELDRLWRSKFGDVAKVVKYLDGQTTAYQIIQWLICDWYELDKLHRNI